MTNSRKIRFETELNKKKIDSTSVTALLNCAQELWGYIPPDLFEYIARHANTTPAQIQSIINFNSCYSTDPSQAPKAQVCTGHSCSKSEALAILQQLKKEYGDTAISTCRCFGHCAQAPVVKIAGTIHEKMSIEKTNTLLRT